MLPGCILKLFDGTRQLIGIMLNVRFRFKRLRLTGRFRLRLGCVLLFPCS